MQTLTPTSHHVLQLTVHQTCVRPSVSGRMRSGTLAFGLSGPSTFSGLQPGAHICPPSITQCLSSPPSSLSPPGKPRFCLGEGSYSSGSGVPSTTLTVTVCCPTAPAHQTSICPSIPTQQQPCTPLCWTPCKHLPTSGPGFLPPGSPFPGPPRDVCLGRLSSCFVCRGKNWARGYPGAEDSVRNQRGRESGGVGSRGCPQVTAPQAGRCCASWVWQAQRSFSGGGRAAFPGVGICSSS